jgi:hypothetical protein
MFLSFHSIADGWIPYVAGRKENCSEAFEDLWMRSSWVLMRGPVKRKPDHQYLILSLSRRVAALSDWLLKYDFHITFVRQRWGC